MKILHLSYSDTVGGAAIAASRLHRGLRKKGINSWMMVARKGGQDRYTFSPNSSLHRIFTLLKPRLDSIPNIIWQTKKGTIWSNNWFPSQLVKEVNKFEADIINLHWINNDFLDLRSLSQIEAKIVWTMHDACPITGGCHYPSTCRKYAEHCQFCPQLKSNFKKDLSYYGFEKKSQVYSQLNMSAVVPSEWLAQAVRISPLWKNRSVETIANGLDLNNRKSIDRENARNRLNLPLNKKIICFGAHNINISRKGFDLLIKSLKKLRDISNHKILLTIFGRSKNLNQKEIPYPVKNFGFITNPRKIDSIYSASDVFVCPSREDNLPNTVIEALANKTPVASFGVGGIPEIIDHKQNGYIAQKFDIASLTRGIEYCLFHQQLKEKARNKIEENFSMDLQVEKYVKLYKKLLSETKHNNQQ